MTAVHKIERVLQTGVLINDLVVVPPEGATDDAIRAEQAAIGRSFSDEFRAFLKRWNGANLDVVVFFGCQESHPEIPQLRDRQSLLSGDMRAWIVIGSDPAGFVFAETPEGEVISIDTQSDVCETVGSSFDEFVCRFVFGEDSHLFADEDWKQELQEAGLLP